MEFMTRMRGRRRERQLDAWLEFRRYCFLQNDFDIANQAGASFRSDINSALQSLAGNSSGASAPATTYAYQWWADTTTGLLKIRNAANSAWITVGTLASLGYSVIDAAGDLLYGSAADTAARLAIGTAGQLLRVNAGGTAPEWGTVKTQLPLRASSGTETLVAADMGKIIVPAASTLTLPLLSAVSDGDVIGFELNAAVSVTVQRQGTDQLSWNGVAALNSVMLTQYGDYLLLWADKTSSRWRVLSEHIQGPYFRAEYEGIGQAIGTNTVTKLQFNTEIADSHGYYDPVTNFRFTPLIPGWYMVSISAYISGAAAARSAVIIYKNGIVYTYGQRSYSTNDGVYTVSFPIQMNGTTDYIEAYGVCIDAGGTFDDAIESHFDAVRIR